MRLIDAEYLLSEIAELKKSPWYNTFITREELKARAEAIEIIEDLCIKNVEKELATNRPKGKWKYEFLCPPVSCSSSTRVTCTRCGYSRQRIDGEILKYCPNCGEEMRN